MPKLFRLYRSAEAVPQVCGIDFGNHSWKWMPANGCYPGWTGERPTHTRCSMTEEVFVSERQAVAAADAVRHVGGRDWREVDMLEWVQELEERFAAEGGQWALENCLTPDDWQLCIVFGSKRTFATVPEDWKASEDRPAVSYWIGRGD